MDHCSQARRSVEAARARASTLYHGYGRSLLKGAGIEYVDFREYQPGDDYRRIDWRLSARSPAPLGIKLYVKEYEEEHMHRVTLAISLDHSIFYKDKPYTLAYTASIISHLAARLGDDMTLALMGGGVEWASIDPVKAPSRIRAAVCSGPRGPVEGEIVEVAAQARRGTLVYIIDYNIDPGRLAEALRKARTRDLRVLTAIVYSRLEVYPPGRGVAALSSGSSTVFGELEGLYRMIRAHVNRVDAVASAYSSYVKLEKSLLGEETPRLVRRFLSARGRLAR